jgi:hypothetical protein
MRGQAPGSAVVQLPGAAPGQALGAPSSAGSAMPYVFAGRMIDKSEVTLFLLGNSRPILAKVNDVIDGLYRVDKITNANAVMTYLPTNTQQTVFFNSTAIGSSALSEHSAEPIVDSRPVDRAEIPLQMVGVDHRNVPGQAKNR